MNLHEQYYRELLGALKNHGINLRAGVTVSLHELEYMPQDRVMDIITHQLARAMAEELMKKKTLITHHSDRMNYAEIFQADVFVFTPEELCSFCEETARVMSQRTGATYNGEASSRNDLGLPDLSRLLGNSQTRKESCPLSIGVREIK